jgi:hypothetical protein
MKLKLSRFAASDEGEMFFPPVPEYFSRMAQWDVLWGRSAGAGPLASARREHPKLRLRRLGSML